MDVTALRQRLITHSERHNAATVALAYNTTTKMLGRALSGDPEALDFLLPRYDSAAQHLAGVAVTGPRKLSKPAALRLFEIVQLYGADDAARHLGVTLQIIQRGVCGMGLQPASYLALVEGIPGLDGGPPIAGAPREAYITEQS